MNAPKAGLVPAAEHVLDLSVSAAPGEVLRMHRHRVAFPWSIGRAFGGGAAEGPLRILPQVAGAGLLSGDSRRQRLRVGPDAAVRVEDAGAIVVHRGARGPAATAWRYEVAAGARLTIAAEPYALSPGSSLHLKTCISCDPNGVFVGFEGLCLAGGGAADWRSETTVRDPSGVIRLIDRQHAEPADYARLGALPRKVSAFGSVLILSPPNQTPTLSLPNVAGAFVGMTRLRGGVGVGVRLAAESGGALREAALSIMGQLA